MTVVHGRQELMAVYEYLREQSKRNWVREMAPDFFTSGEAAEGMTAFTEKREPDFSRFRR